ncbi:uncharacterized protein [Montipora capricornis]|uniref:uncharacterized protein n=1 Tax=Montipora capricornis TaxID=246305 RepID=UPI0035F15265
MRRHAYLQKEMESSNLQLEDKFGDEKNPKKRKWKDASLEEEDGDDCLNNLSSTLRNVCNCFGVGGLYNSKKRKIESTFGRLLPLSSDWNLGDKIQMLSMDMKQRYGKELSEVSFRLLGLMKQVSQLFKELHGGRKFLKDITMDIFLKDVKTRPSLPIPIQYVEIGLWKQVMQINQQICHQMEEMDKMDLGSSDKKKENVAEPTEDQTDVNKGSDVSDKKSTFRDYYMDMVTANFGDDLDHLRKEGSLDPRKIEMLIDCLEIGKDIWSDLEKSLLQHVGP